MGVALVLVVMSGAFMGGAVIVAVPALLDFTRRRNQGEGMRRLRERAESDKIDFSARDRQTLS